MTSTLVSSFVSRAEELSSPYMATLRQRSPLMDRTALKVVELAKQYEVEAYVKKADALAEKAALETQARRARYTDQLKTLEQLAASRVDVLAASVVTLVDRVLPEDEGDAVCVDAETPMKQVRQLPRVVLARGNRAANSAVVFVSAKQEQTRTALRVRRDEVMAIALNQKAQATEYGRRSLHAVAALFDDLRDEADLRTMPLRDSLLTHRAQLLLKYKAVVAAAAAKRGVYTQLAWAKYQEAGLEEYALMLRSKSVAFKGQVEAMLAATKLRAVERSGEVRTLYLEYKDKIVAVSVGARAQLSVKIVAVKDELSGRWAQQAAASEAMKTLGTQAQRVQEQLQLAKTQATENYTLAKTQLLQNTEEARRAAKERTAALIEETKARTAAQRAKVAELTETMKERGAIVKAKVVEVAGQVRDETPAVAGSLATRFLGETRGMQVQKQMAHFLESLPIVAVA
jgi:hypothetical protein